MPEKYEEEHKDKIHITYLDQHDANTQDQPGGESDSHRHQAIICLAVDAQQSEPIVGLAKEAVP